MSIVTPTILSDGQRMDARYELLALDITHEVNRLPYAQLTLSDGSIAQQKFAISNTPFFEPGKRVEIKLRYEGDATSEASVFQGIVVGQRVEAGEQGSLLTVALKDAAVKMTYSRKSVVYRDKSDDAIIAELLRQHGLQQGELAQTDPVHPELVQYDCTDWDFMVARAEANGRLVVVEAGRIALHKLERKGAPKLPVFDYGLTEMIDFEIAADLGQQCTSVASLGWNIKEQRPSRMTAKEVALTPGNLNGKKLATALGVKATTQRSLAPLDPKELAAWADGALARSRLALIRGRIAVRGRPDLKPLDVITIRGVGDRFNGDTLVTGIRHRVDHLGWQTDIQFGLAAERFAQRPEVIEPPAGGLLPAVNGLQIGVVAPFEEDQTNELRVRVQLPGLAAEQDLIWARLATPDAGNARGYYFRPEAGDEVVVGFFNDDPRHAVILGALYSSKNKPPAVVGQPTKENKQKALVTKKGTTISFLDEDKAALLIQTPAKNKILLDDDAGAIQIHDQHGNQLTLNKDGITIKSAKDLKLEASGSVEIKGQKVDIK